MVKNLPNGSSSLLVHSKMTNLQKSQTSIESAQMSNPYELKVNSAGVMIRNKPVPQDSIIVEKEEKH